RMFRVEVDRKLQIDLADILAALAAERGAEAEQDFGGAGGGGTTHGVQLLTGLELGDGGVDQRMVRQHQRERVVNLLRRLAIAVARSPTRISVDGADRIGIEP